MNPTPDDLDEIELESIDRKTNKELFELGKILKITKYTSMVELRQQIILSVMMRKKSVIKSSYYTDDFKLKKETTFKEDELRRSKLKAYVDKINSIYDEIQKLDKVKMTSGIDVSEKDDPLQTKISNEFNNIKTELKRKRELLEKIPNCALLICGDSGSGKSSFINLLVDNPVLPVSIRSNSVCQVRMTYGDVDCAEIIDLENKTIKIEKHEFKDKLKSYLENLDDRTEISCNSATIYLKSAILEGGLDIYDTIGVGETKMFNEQVLKELKDITGVLFLLKKNNPIGDNTVGGLSKVINHIAKNGIPGGSMHFIINMCDLLEKSSEKELLKENVEKQLRDKCSCLNPEITTFSAKQELFMQEHKYMSKDYEKITSLIQQLHLNSINTNTVSVFEFLFQFVCKTIDYIIESENFTVDDKVKKKDYIKKLRNLEADRKLLNQLFKKNNELFLKNKSCDYKQKIEKHLKNDETKRNVVNEVISKQSNLFGLTNKDEIDQEILKMTKNSIIKSFKEFVEKENILKNCCNEMLKIFLQQFAEHQKKKDEINQAMSRHINTVMETFTRDFKTMDFNDLIGLPVYQRKLLQLFTPIMVPGIEIKNIVKQRFEGWYSAILSKFNLSNVHKFYEDTTTYVSNRSSQYYDKFVYKKRNIQVIMECLFFAPLQVTQDFEKYLADDMNYLAKNIDLLDEDMRNKVNVIKTYKDIKERLEVINNELCQIDLLYMQKDKNDIVLDKSEILKNSTKVLYNRNCHVYSGDFANKQIKNSNILVYESMDNKNWTKQYQDIIKYREILLGNHDKINAEYMKHFLAFNLHILSSVRDDNFLYPMFSVQRFDSTLKAHIDNFREDASKIVIENNSLYNEIVRLLGQIINGLIYLHSCDPPLNHYDLTLESIGFDTNEAQIKLSSVSVSTKVEIDYSIESKEELLKITHLPIDILEKNSKELYTPHSDMYCMGTILYYLWTGINPFSNIIDSYKIKSVEMFVEIMKKSKHHVLIDHTMFHSGFPDMVFIWCTLFWENKLTAKTFSENLRFTTFYGSKIDALMS